jgi:hypothetical protein
MRQHSCQQPRGTHMGWPHTLPYHCCRTAGVLLYDAVGLSGLTLSLMRWKSSSEMLRPAARDMAIKCRTALVEPPAGTGKQQEVRKQHEPAA